MPKYKKLNRMKKNNQFVEYAKEGLLHSNVQYDGTQEAPILLQDENICVNIFGLALLGKFKPSMAVFLLEQGTNFDLGHTLGLTEAQITMLKQLSLLTEKPKDLLHNFEQLCAQVVLKKV